MSCIIPQKITVKPLAWNETLSFRGMRVWTPVSAIFQDWIVESEGEYLWCLYVSIDHWPASPVLKSFDSVDEAKAALQNKYEQEIYAAIVLNEKASVAE